MSSVCSRFGRIRSFLLGLAVIVMLAMPSLSAEKKADLPAAGQPGFLVTDYGANGQDSEKDTVAFQKTIDACTAAGGGVVLVPSGRYELGRIHLKDNVTLYLCEGSLLRASTEKADYPALDGSPKSHYKKIHGENANNCRYAVIYAYEAENIAITGRGKIDGRDREFWTVKNTGDYPKYRTVGPWHYFTPHKFRPILVIFEECTNTFVRDVTLVNASCYSGWFAGCRYMKFERVTIFNNPDGPNTDGFHFSSSENVHLTDCDFVCGDDCIAVDPNHDGPSRNFTITGCTFDTSVNVFRIYTGLDPNLPKDQPHGQVSDITATGCSVKDASGVFNVTADQGDIRRLSFSNFTINMEYRGSAFFFMTTAGGTIRDIVLDNMAIRTDGIGTIAGENGRIGNITLSNLRYEVVPRTKVYGNELPDPVPGYSIAHFAPYYLLARHVNNLKMVDLQIDWGEADLADLDKVKGRADWSAIRCLDVRGLDLRGIVCSPFGNESPAIEFKDVRDALVSGCRAKDGTGLFLQVSGASENIGLFGNDLIRAAQAYRTIDPLPASTVTASNNLAK